MEGILSDNQVIVMAKTAIRMNPAMRTTFQVAVNHMSELIGSTFHNASNQGLRPARKVSRMEAGRGGRGRGRGRQGKGGRGGRGQQHGKFHNGVDITDLTRNFTRDEWVKLSPEIMQQVKEAREAAKANRNKKRNVSAAGAAPEKGGGGKEPMETEDQQEAVPSNGNNFGSGAYSQGNKKARWTPKST